MWYFLTNNCKLSTSFAFIKRCHHGIDFVLPAFGWGDTFAGQFNLGFPGCQYWKPTLHGFAVDSSFE